MKSTILSIFVFVCLRTYAQNTEALNWINVNANEIKLQNNTLDQFTFLDWLLKDKRIVMHGENTHGARE